MKRFLRSKLALSLIAVVILAGAIAVPLAGSGTRSHAVAPTTFSGDGIVAKASVASTSLSICDTGPLPSSGTPPVSCSVLNGTLNVLTLVSGTIAVATADSSTIGSTVTTHASAATTSLLLAGLGVNADLLSSVASATCTNGNPSVSGDSTIVNLKIDSLATLNGPFPPNTPLIGISLLGFTVTGTLNEQITTANSITVNALHLHITDPLGIVSPIDVVISSSHADVNCGGGPPPGATFPADGAFVLGDVSAANSLNTGATVTWWDLNWSQLNSLSGGPAPARYGGPNSARFEGFVSVDHPLPACGVTWSDTKKEETPPTSVPQYMLVVVSSKITRSGKDTLSGKIIEIVIVKTDPGYNGNPNTPGTGTVVGVFCHS